MGSFILIVKLNPIKKRLSTFEHQLNFKYVALNRSIKIN